MSVFKDDTINITGPIIQYMQNSYEACSTNLYRMRTPLGASAIGYMLSQLRLSKQLSSPNEDDRFNFRLCTKAIPRTDEEDYTDITDAIDSECNTLILRNNTNRFGLVIVNTNACPKNTEAALKAVQDAQANTYIEIDMRHALTLNPFHETHVLKHRTLKLAIIFTNTLSDTFLLHVGAILPTIFGEQAIEPVANAMLAEDKLLYGTALEVQLRVLKVRQRKSRVASNLKSVMLNLNDSEISNLEYNLKEKREYIKNLLSEYSGYLTETTKLEEQLLGMRTKGAGEAVNTFIDYVLNYKADTVIDVLTQSDSSLVFVIKTPLLYFNKSHFEYYKDSTRSNCYTDAPKETQELIKDLFLNNKYTLMMTNSVRIEFNKYTVAHISVTEYALDYIQEGMPNPHMFRFNCWGNNEPLIRQALKDREYITALEQIVGAVSGLNISDSAVFKYFVAYLQNNHIMSIPILQDNTTKEWLTINDYNKKLQEVNNNASN